jgi:hypothetical protein
MHVQRTACTSSTHTGAWSRCLITMDACCILPAAWTLATAQRSRSAVPGGHTGPPWPFAVSRLVSYNFDLS